MSTGGAKLLVVNASSGPSGPYDSRKRRFMRFMRSCSVENSRNGSQRVNPAIISSFLNNVGWFSLRCRRSVGFRPKKVPIDEHIQSETDQILLCGDSPCVLLPQFRLRLQPIFEFVTRHLPTLRKQFVGAITDLLLKVAGRVSGFVGCS